MAGSIAELLVKLGLDKAEFTTGLAKAVEEARSSATRIKESFAGNLLAGFAKDAINQLAQVPAQMAAIVTSAIDAADHLNDLSKKTGIAVETLGGIGFAAKQAGGDLDSAAAGVGKLNKALAEAASGNKESAEAFRVLGISVKDAAGNTKNADQVLVEVADKFAGFADGPEKAALALRLFGKAGADMIPLLDEGGAALLKNIAYFERYSGVSKETAEAADQFNDSLTKVKLLQGAFGQQLAAELLPSLQALADMWLANKEKGDGFKSVAQEIADVLRTGATLAFAAAQAFLTFGRAVGGVIAANIALAKGDFAGAKSIWQEMAADVIGATKRVLDFNTAIQSTRAALKQISTAADFQRTDKDTTPGKKPSAPRLRTGEQIADDPTKKLLDARLKDIETGIQRERDLLATRNRFIELFNSQNLLSINAYYDARAAAQADAVRAEQRGIDEEIAALQQFQNRRATTQKDRADAEIKIIELRARRARVEQAADADAIERSIRQAEAVRELERAFQSVNAAVLEAEGHLAEAAAIRFDQQNRSLREVFSANNNQAGLQALDSLRAAAIATAALQKAANDTRQSFDALADAEARLGIAQQRGALTSIEALVKLGEARRAQIPLLEAQVQAEEAIARAAQAAGTAGFDQLIQKAEASRIALERLKAAADPVAETINTKLGEEATSALEDFATGAKSAADAFRSFAKSVLNDILRLGSKSIAEAIFGGSGGIGGAISKFLSEQGVGAGIIPKLSVAAPAVASGPSIGPAIAAAGGTAASAAQSVADAATKAAGDVVDAAGQLGDSMIDLVLQTSNASSGMESFAKSAGDAISSLFSGGGGGSSAFSDFVDAFSGFFASGGSIGPGRWGVVGENGPEIAFGGTAGKKIEPLAMGSGTTQHINVNVQGAPGQSRDSLLQQGAAIGLGIQRALARNT